MESGNTFHSQRPRNGRGRDDDESTLLPPPPPLLPINVLAEYVTTSSPPKESRILLLLLIYHQPPPASSQSKWKAEKGAKKLYIALVDGGGWIVAVARQPHSLPTEEDDKQAAPRHSFPSLPLPPELMI